MPGRLIRLIVAAALALAASALPGSSGAQTEDDDARLLLPASELDGTWVVYQAPAGPTDARSRGQAVTYLDSLDFSAPRYLQLSAATFDHETLADAAVYDTAMNEQRQGLKISPVSGVGDGRAYRSLLHGPERSQAGLVLRVANVGLVVRISTTEALSEDDANAAVDQVAQQVQDWVHSVLDASSFARPGAS